MRALAAVAALGVFTSGVKAQTAPPQSCYVAQVAIVVDDVADFKYHRVVIAGIRQLDAASAATAGNCESRDIGAIAAMRTAVEARFDSSVIKPPHLRTTIELRHADLNVVRSEIVRLARLAYNRAGSFTRVEHVSVGTAPELALPRLSSDDTATEACSKDNAALERTGAKFRWAC